jgi:arginase
MELGFVLGLDVPDVLRAAIGPGSLVAAADVCIMGARDKDVLQKTGVRLLSDTVELYSDSDLLNGGIETMTRKAVKRLDSAHRLWLHIDLDASSTESLPVVDYQQPGGLSWEQLEALGKTAMSHGGIAGCDVTIYNPDIDPDGRLARRIVSFLGSLIASAR